MDSGVDTAVLGVDISVLVLNALVLSVDISVLVLNALVLSGGGRVLVSSAQERGVLWPFLALEATGAARGGVRTRGGQSQGLQCSMGDTSREIGRGRGWRLPPLRRSGGGGNRRGGRSQGLQCSRVL